MKSIDPIEVAYGTTVDNVGLPDEVTVKFIDGTEEEVKVTWDTSSYDGEKAGKYEFDGTLDSQSIDNPNNAMGNIKVIVKEKPDKVIESVAKNTDIVVDVNATINELGLPETVGVTLDDGTTMDFDVDWDTGSYEGKTVGNYKLTGKLQLISGIVNPNQLDAEIIVIVKDEKESDPEEEEKPGKDSDDKQDDPKNGEKISINDEEKSDTLPNTATSIFNMLALGLGLLAIGAVIIVLTRRRSA